MELRLQTARATKDIDLSMFGESQKKDQILERLQDHAANDLGDGFVFTIGVPQKDLDGPPDGGYRFPVVSFIAGRVFTKFHLDRIASERANVIKLGNDAWQIADAIAVGVEKALRINFVKEGVGEPGWCVPFHFMDSCLIEFESIQAQPNCKTRAAIPNPQSISPAAGSPHRRGIRR